MKNSILESVFPTLLIISIAISSGLFIITPVTDRQDKLRYLLNFAGITPFSYYMGLFLADCILFITPCILIILLAIILQLETITKNAWHILLALTAFGIVYMPVNYLIAHMFSQTETAFKYQGFVIIIMLTLRPILELIVT